MSNTLLELSHATKHFQGQPIFEDLNLMLSPEEFKVILGPSGCGKSTLFNALTGITSLDWGTILWQGDPVPDIGQVAAYMQQKDLLLPWASLLDNALLPARVAGTPLGTAAARAKNLLTSLGLAGYEAHRPHEVSKGMRQRCALVRTLMFDRDLILLDEPLSALDANTRIALQSLLLLLQTEFGITVLMITHDIQEALLLADEICLVSGRPMTVLKTLRLDMPKPRVFNAPGLMDLKADLVHRLKRGGSCD
jgi:NitT/TauT family transport system ATP-binding protein